VEFGLPAEVIRLIDTLKKNGFKAYIVGGCVRDMLLGKTPKDWDICTSATPEQVMSVFCEEVVIPTGLKHGTVTLVIDHKPYEITTFRMEWDYSDNRRPDRVEFIEDIKEDLARRDLR